ncbi:nucleotidyl transferase AbiEii/AbiGii toxin family protein [Candidatus Marsarchaeota archaeon]|nr:nucleotidyl transferase AbiEii/AbiGii toxin family protein [Candidatus Marsarchaeota archaeon]
MISKEELEAYSTYKDKYQVEKDYLQELILYSVCSNSTYDLVFKGGTALSKFYNSDRFSEDLDFTSNKIDKTGVKSLIDKAIKSIQYNTVYLEEPYVNEFGTIVATISILGPRYNGKPSTAQQILFEINTGATLVEKAVPMPRNPIYPDAKNYVALVMGKREILAEKVRAMMSKGRRHKERDLYDMYYLIGKDTRFNKEMILKKISESKITFSAEELVEYMKRVQATWKTLQPFIQHTLEEYEYVSKTVISAMERDKVL